MNEWLIVGIAVVGTVLVLGGGGWLIRAMRGGNANKS